MSKKLLISVDGGGALGIGPLMFLAALEAALGGFSEAALSGTSVGGLLVMCRAIGMTWADIEVLFRERVKQIFADPSWLWRMDPTRPKWTNAIEAVCRDVFGDRRCCDVKLPFYIPSADMVTGAFKVWDATDNEFLRNVVLYTTAAPTYFSPRNDQGACGGRYVDGGTLANNPILVGMTGMFKMGTTMQEVACLSFDTGGAYWKDPKIGARTTKVGWIQPIIDIALQGTATVPRYIAEAFMRASRVNVPYMRIGPTDPRDYEMDDLASLPEFEKLWQQVWADRGAEAQALVKSVQAPDTAL